MESHHFIKEKSLRESCPYCHNKIEDNKWTSSFDTDRHYKIAPCDRCGRSIRFKVEFKGSGHDHISNNGNLENKLK